MYFRPTYNSNNWLGKGIEIKKMEKKKKLAYTFYFLLITIIYSLNYLCIFVFSFFFFGNKAELTIVSLLISWLRVTTLLMGFTVCKIHFHIVCLLFSLLFLTGKAIVENMNIFFGFFLHNLRRVEYSIAH